MKFLITAWMVMVCTYSTTVPTGKEKPKLVVVVDERQSEYEKEIRDVLHKEKVDAYTIELLVAQSKHESDNYTNNLTKYNNIFARHYHKTDTFAISAGAEAEGHRRFAKYPSVKYATLSQLWYFKKLKYSFKWKSTYQFALELKQKRYYEAPLQTYTLALNQFMKNDIKK